MARNTAQKILDALMICVGLVLLATAFWDVLSGVWSLIVVRTVVGPLLIFMGLLPWPPNRLSKRKNP